MGLNLRKDSRVISRGITPFSTGRHLTQVLTLHSAMLPQHISPPNRSAAHGAWSGKLWGKETSLGSKLRPHSRLGLVDGGLDRTKHPKTDPCSSLEAWRAPYSGFHRERRIMMSQTTQLGDAEVRADPGTISDPRVSLQSVPVSPQSSSVWNVVPMGLSVTVQDRHLGRGGFALTLRTVQGTCL
jgi:hypothetical protein